MSVELALHALLRETLEKGGSFLHIEPALHGATLRIRKDRTLCELRTISREMYMTLWQNITDKFGPGSLKARFLEGSFRFKGPQSQHLVRASVVPTPRGDSLVLKMSLHQSGGSGLDALGMAAPDRDYLARLLRRTTGLFLIAAPSGCGGSSSLRSCLEDLNDGTRKIITLERPIELDLEGVQQVEIGCGRPGSPCLETSAAAYDAVAPQNADVIGFSVLRDRDGASTAIQVALSGLLSLARIHAFTLEASIGRLLSLGVTRRELAACLSGILYQVLLRRNCPHCSQSFTSRETGSPRHPGEFEGFGEEARRGAGCEACRNTGSDGFIPVFELIDSHSVLEGLLEGWDGGLRNAEADSPVRRLTEKLKALVLGGKVPPEEYYRWTRPAIRSRIASNEAD